MKILTKKQKEFLTTRNIKVGSTYPFPTYGFTAYSLPEYGCQTVSVETNPFTKSLANQLFEISRIEGDFCKGNFAHNPKGVDWWMHRNDLENRALMEMAVYFLLSFIPMIIYNLFTGKYRTNETI